MPYITARKLLNLALNQFDLKLKRRSPWSLPPFIKIEPTAQCQLRCAGCWHRDIEFKRQFTPADSLTLDSFRHILEPIARTTVGISISFRGEPLLNRGLPALIGYAHEKGIATTFPTNLSMPITPEYAEQLIASGLDTIYVSLDGASEESYRQYRIGGDFNRVLANVRLLADTRLRMGARRPRLIWKMVIFEQNRNEIPIQEQKYKEYGFDGYERVIDWQSRSYAALKDARNRSMIEKKSGCYWLWNAAVITFNGEVRPCCTHESFGLGNAVQQDFGELWRAPAYQSLRAAFSTRTYGTGMNPVCSKCIGLADSVAEPVPVLTQIRA